MKKGICSFHKGTKKAKLKVGPFISLGLSKGNQKFGLMFKMREHIQNQTPEG
jgi:hypothetical protein